MIACACCECIPVELPTSAAWGCFALARTMRTVGGATARLGPWGSYVRRAARRHGASAVVDWIGEGPGPRPGDHSHGDPGLGEVARVRVQAVGQVRVTTAEREDRLGASGPLTDTASQLTDLRTLGPTARFRRIPAGPHCGCRRSGRVVGRQRVSGGSAPQLDGARVKVVDDREPVGEYRAGVLPAAPVTVWCLVRWVLGPARSPSAASALEKPGAFPFIATNEEYRYVFPRWRHRAPRC
jgi:hypothetical protein